MDKHRGSPADSLDMMRRRIEIYRPLVAEAMAALAKARRDFDAERIDATTLATARELAAFRRRKLKGMLDIEHYLRRILRANEPICS